MHERLDDVLERVDEDGPAQWQIAPAVEVLAANTGFSRRVLADVLRLAVEVAERREERIGKPVLVSAADLIDAEPAGPHKWRIPR